MQQIQIPFTDVPKNVLKNLLLDRSIVFYPNENELYIKNKGNFHKVSKGEGLNIDISEDKVFSLEENIVVKGTKVQKGDLVFYYNEYLGEVSPTKQILLLIDISQGGGIGGNIQVVGVDFPQKNSITIIGKNNTEFIINENGTITGVTKEDFPLYYSFKEPITNSSSLFKDVKCFSKIDVSKMDSSRIVDSSNMFENCNCKEIYFETEDISGRKHYFGTTENKSARQMFMNCNNLKKIRFPSSFNVGKSTKEMFKGCSMLKDVNISLLSSTEIVSVHKLYIIIK